MRIEIQINRNFQSNYAGDVLLKEKKICFMVGLYV